MKHLDLITLENQLERFEGEMADIGDTVDELEREGKELFESIEETKKDFQELKKSLKVLRSQLENYKKEESLTIKEEKLGARAGQAWSKEEDKELLYNVIRAIEQIAVKHQRSFNGIAARICHLELVDDWREISKIRGE